MVVLQLLLEYYGIDEPHSRAARSEDVLTSIMVVSPTKKLSSYRGGQLISICEVPNPEAVSSTAIPYTRLVYLLAMR